MDLEELSQRMDTFVEAQGWYQEGSPRPQTPRNLSISLALEAAEVLEIFQWGESYGEGDLAGELADVLLYLLQIARITGIDLEQAVQDKLGRNYRRSWESGK